jgi:hypothetical protein
MAVSKILKAALKTAKPISKTKQQQAERLFKKHQKGSLTAREVEKELNNLGLQSASPYVESKSIGMYQLRPKGANPNTTQNTILMDLRKKDKQKTK